MRHRNASILVAALGGIGCVGANGTRDSGDPNSLPTSSSSGGSGSDPDGSAASDGPGGDAESGDAAGSDSGSPPDDSGSGETDSGGGTDDSGIRFDVGAGTDTANGGDGGGQVGCKKVDFLFVIDNSGSMKEEQEQLAASFPGFVAEIERVVEDADFHIMVTDSDADAATRGCGGSPGDPSVCVDWCAECPEGCDCICAGTPCPPKPNCDGVLGAGQIIDQMGNACNVTGGGRFMTEAQPDLTNTFSCIALVGTGGDGNERPMEAAMLATNDLVQPGQCNEGFLRDDAILVVTVISDEEDAMKSVGDPASWKEALVNAKGGDEDAVVALAVVGDPVDQQPAGCDADDAPRMRNWAESFTFGQWGSVCAPDYTPFFQKAVSVVEGACDVFVPPG